MGSKTKLPRFQQLVHFKVFVSLESLSWKCFQNNLHLTVFLVSINWPTLNSSVQLIRLFVRSFLTKSHFFLLQMNFYYSDYKLLFAFLKHGGYFQGQLVKERKNKLPSATTIVRLQSLLHLFHLSEGPSGQSPMEFSTSETPQELHWIIISIL